MMTKIATQNFFADQKDGGVGVSRKEQGEEGTFFTEKRIRRKRTQKKKNEEK